MSRAINEDRGKKRLFICCDGTWKNASGTTAPLTNVASFARAIDWFGVNTDYPASPVTQLIYYSGGVGSQSVLVPEVDSLHSGLTGAGYVYSIAASRENHHTFRRVSPSSLGEDLGAAPPRLSAPFRCDSLRLSWSPSIPGSDISLAG